jgi:hypothetical protein
MANNAGVRTTYTDRSADGEPVVPPADLGQGQEPEDAGRPAVEPAPECVSQPADAGLDYQYGQVILYDPWGKLWFPSPPPSYDLGPPMTVDTHEPPSSCRAPSPTQGPD